ncbi:MAG: hypothetical protein JWO11_4137 [Nocardioides sp.]|nr:hypothetical protein [Nocardioides sp.]
MDELIAFLRDRLNEDEQAARACIQEVGAGHTGDPYADGSGVADRDDYPSYPWGAGEAESAYMARTQPDRVLREIDAKRRIIEHNRRIHQRADPVDHPEQAYVLAAGASDYVLKILALLHSDHEDYQESWRP